MVNTKEQRKELRKMVANMTRGIVCPACGGKMDKVIDSRPDDNAYRRRRECCNCGRRVNTREEIY